MYVSKRRTKRPAAKRPYKRRARTSGKPSKALVRTINKVLSRKLENKAWFDYAANQTITSVSAGVPIYRNLVPTLSQGTGHSARVGNEINVKSGVIRGHVNVLPYNVTSNNLPAPFYVKMWLVSAKQINTTSLSSTSIALDFFDVVNSSVGLQANMLDLDLTINKDAWTCYGQKIIKIGGGYNSSTGPYNPGNYFDNSPMSAPFSFNFGKHLKKIKYSDSVIYPENRNMFIIFQCVSANGADTTSQIPAEFHYTTRVEYEDA